ncbi:MAG: ATP-binding protein [Elusimicrobiota bacterium]
MAHWVFRKFSRKLSLMVGVILVCAMALTDLLLTRALRRQFIDEVASNLLVQADLIEMQLRSKTFSKKAGGELQSMAKQYDRTCDCRVTFVSKDGAVLADSSLTTDEIIRMENHKGRPEISTALAGSPGHSIRYSETIRQDMLYAATPLRLNGTVHGVVRVAMSLAQVEQKIAGVRKTIATITIFMILAAILASLWMSRSISQPLAEMSRIAEKLAQGDYSARVRPRLPDEHGQLGATLNLLAQKVQSAIHALSQEKAHLSAILSNMTEAVIAVDETGHVLAVNPALTRLFGIQPQECVGKPFLEVIRNNRLSALLNIVIKDSTRQQDEVKVLAPEEAVFEAQAVPLLMEERCIGALLVLHDITRLRQLEQIRKDFVANVSHEIKTPLASIKAFAETLRTGAIDDPANRKEFVEIIEKDADRMMRLVDDLLELSSIESGRRAPNFEPVALAECAMAVAASLAPLADRKQVRVDIRIPDNLPLLRADNGQLRQVLTNLLDNAIKFNKDEGSVTVKASANQRIVTVVVQDTGSGITAENLPRIFERFYRVDKARSCELGGTGLGLAIVKHIIDAHGGSVGVESKPGQGSTFRFTLPTAA